MIGIIGAMAEEITAIQAQMRNVSTISHQNRTFYTGSIHNTGIVLVQAGIGKTNAAVTTTLLLSNFKVEAIINVGVAGGQNGVSHEDIVISTATVYHDVNVTNFGHYVHGQVPGERPEYIADQNLIQQIETALIKLQYRYKIGRIASGDQFVYNPETVQAINQVYDNIYAIEMEACAIAHTATIFNVPFVIIRSISDVLGDETQSTDYDLFLESSCQKVAQVIDRFLQLRQ